MIILERIENGFVVDIRGQKRFFATLDESVAHIRVIVMALDAEESEASVVSVSESP